MPRVRLACLCYAPVQHHQPWRAADTSGGVFVLQDLEQQRLAAVLAEAQAVRKRHDEERRLRQEMAVADAQEQARDPRCSIAFSEMSLGTCETTAEALPSSGTRRLFSIKEPNGRTCPFVTHILKWSGEFRRLIPNTYKNIRYPSASF